MLKRWHDIGPPIPKGAAEAGRVSEWGEVGSGFDLGLRETTIKICVAS